MADKFEQRYHHVNGLLTVYSQDRIDTAQKDIDEYLRLKEKVKQYGGVKMGKYKQYIQEQDDKTWRKIQDMCLESETVEEVLQNCDQQMINGKMYLPLGYFWNEFEEEVRELWQEVWYDKQQEAMNEYEQEQNNT